MRATTIHFTEEQVDQIVPILAAMSDGEACFAQVFIDGIRVRALDQDTTLRVQAAIGQVLPGEPGARTADEADRLYGSRSKA